MACSVSLCRLYGTRWRGPTAAADTLPTSRTANQAAFLNGGSYPAPSTTPATPLRRRRPSVLHFIFLVIGAVAVVGLMSTADWLLFGSAGLGVSGSNSPLHVSGLTLAAPPPRFSPPLFLRSLPLQLHAADVPDAVEGALLHLLGEYSGAVAQSWAADRMPLLPPDTATTLPIAGLPRFPRLFARDTFVSCLLMGNSEATLAMVRVFAALQGTRADSVSGMEPGKVSSRVRSHTSLGCDGAC